MGLCFGSLAAHGPYSTLNRPHYSGSGSTHDDIKSVASSSDRTSSLGNSQFSVTSSGSANVFHCDSRWNTSLRISENYRSDFLLSHCNTHMDSYTCSAICVRHSEPLLVVPAEPTPNEMKQVSDIDDQEGLRMHHLLIMFYESNPSMKEADPAKVIVRAISRALVHYYPLAGRLREGPNRKLMLDCNGEGVLFIEAEADIALDQLGDSIGPPCPHWKQFLHQVPGSEGIVGCPLLLIQVTRLSCGGFVFAARMNHVLCDSYGLVQFLDMVGTMARDPDAPVQPPVWQRELFSARNPPRITCMHHEYEDVMDHTTSQYSLHNSNNNNNNNVAHESFFFGPKEILTLRKRLPSKFKTCSTRELLLACLWKCRTLALDMDPNEVVALSCFITAHGRVRMPKGYYGNAFVYPAAISEAGLLCQNPLGYALELIREAKARMNEEYIRSVVDFLVLKGRPLYRTAGHFMVADMTRVGFEQVDFGWGKPIYGGPVGAFPLISYLARFSNSRCEDGIAVPIILPQLVMKRFLMEVVKMTTDDEEIVNNHPNDKMETGVRSKL